MDKPEVQMGIPSSLRQILYKYFSFQFSYSYIVTFLTLSTLYFSLTKLFSHIKELYVKGVNGRGKKENNIRKMVSR